MPPGAGLGQYYISWRQPRPKAVAASHAILLAGGTSGCGVQIASLMVCPLRRRWPFTLSARALARHLGLASPKHLHLMLARRVRKRKRETGERSKRSAVRLCGFEDMRRDGEFVTSCWLWIMKKKRRVNA